ncbi:conjugal transfer protein TrbL family protein [Clostridium sp. WILCCON 0269]|uniref:Conjugal transfer protein TrbL family protein n=1 Tax=Candidatus Clostridium eludens TaxID=3381663 RepID=A0ABW8SU98_9CLOT
MGSLLNDYFISSAKDVLQGSLDLAKKLIFTPQNLPDFANTVYNIFLGVGAYLLAIIVAVKLVNFMSDISNNCADYTVGELITRTVKASVMVVICPFLIKVIVGEIAFPLGNWIFNQISSNAADSLNNYIQSSGIASISKGFMLVVIIGFIAVASACFFIKMCVYQVDLIFLQIYSVPVAISMASDNFNFMDTWWRELISQVLTVITQLICMLGVTWALKNEFTWYNFMILFGCCCNLIKGPRILRDMWYSTGTGRTAMHMGGKLATRAMMVRNLIIRR